MSYAYLPIYCSHSVTMIYWYRKLLLRNIVTKQRSSEPEVNSMKSSNNSPQIAIVKAAVQISEEVFHFNNVTLLASEAAIGFTCNSHLNLYQDWSAIIYTGPAENVYSSVNEIRQQTSQLNQTREITLANYSQFMISRSTFFSLLN